MNSTSHGFAIALSRCAAAAALACLAGNSWAAQIAPNPNPVYNTIVVEGGTSDTNAAPLFVNDGGIVVQHGNTVMAGGELSNLAGSTLINNGTLTAEGWIFSSGIYRNYGLTENYGTMEGDIRNESGGTLINYAGGQAGVNNFGAVSNYGTLSGSNSGTVDNSGVARNFTNEAGGIFNNAAGATLRAGDSTLPWPYSLGVIANAGTINNDGDIIVDASSSLTVNGSWASGGTAAADGVIHNDGVIAIGGAGATATVQAGGTIDGSGTYTQTTGTTTLETGTAESSIVQSEIRIEGGSLTGAGRLESTSAPLYIGPAAIVAPGFSPGTLHVTGDMDFEGTYLADIDGALLHDVIEVSGTATLGATSALDLVINYAPQVGDFFDLLLADVISGAFGAVNAGGYGYDLDLVVDAFGSTDALRLTVTSVPAVVPLPAAFWLFGPALAALGAVRRAACR